MTVVQPTEPMHRARLSLDGLPGVEDVGEWVYHLDLDKWSLRVELRHGASPTPEVPSNTVWHFVVDGTYPAGNVDVYPDKHEGIRSTFPHQMLNSAGDDDMPWNMGNICASTRLRHFGRGTLTQEPWHPSQRLKWYALRSLVWLEAAATGTLNSDTDHFELPDFGVTNRSGLYIAFQETTTSFLEWAQVKDRCGLVELIDIKSAGDVTLVWQFQDLRGKPLITPIWPGRHLDTSRESFFGGWILLSGIPVLPPYQTPQTWRELAQVTETQGVDLWIVLRPLAQRLRIGRDVVLLIGYPIKRRQCDPWSQIQWQATRVPALVTGTRAPNGFRRGKEEGRWQLDRRTSFNPTSSIEWRKTRNWSAEAISARGRYDPGLSDLKVLVIGAGALGSSVAEMLVRGGVQQIGIVDHDLLEIGNLVRHTLTLASHGKEKSTQLVKRLNQMTPNVQAVGYPKRFSPDDVAEYHSYDLVIDTTGEDEVLQVLDMIEWTTPKRIVSISVSLGATRLYFYSSGAATFSAERFGEIMHPLFEADRAAWGEQEWPEEEIGCWSPVFPARYDDITLLASAATKELARQTTEQVNIEQLVTFEQQIEAGQFGGLCRVEHDLGA